MSNYTVIITAHEGRETDETNPQLVLHIDAASGQAKVLAVSVTDPTGQGVTTSNYPRVDLVAVVDAMTEAITSTSNGTQLPSKVTPIGCDPNPETPKSPDNVALVSSKKVLDSKSNAASLSDSEVRDTSRAYRKMPDPDELRRNLEAIGTVTDLAKHYKVPRHTAQGWVGRLRKMSDHGTHT